LQRSGAHVGWKRAGITCVRLLPTASPAAAPLPCLPGLSGVRIVHPLWVGCPAYATQSAVQGHFVFTALFGWLRGLADAAPEPRLLIVDLSAVALRSGRARGAVRNCGNLPARARVQVPPKVAICRAAVARCDLGLTMDRDTPDKAWRTGIKARPCAGARGLQRAGKLRSVSASGLFVIGPDS